MQGANPGTRSDAPKTAQIARSATADKPRQPFWSEWQVGGPVTGGRWSRRSAPGKDPLGWLVAPTAGKSWAKVCRQHLAPENEKSPVSRASSNSGGRI